MKSMSIYRFAYFASMCMLLSCENDTDIILKDVPTNANELTIEETTALQLSVKGTTVPYEDAIKEANYEWTSRANTYLRRQVLLSV